MPCLALEPCCFLVCLGIGPRSAHPDRKSSDLENTRASCKFNLNASSLALPPFASDKFSYDTGANIRFKAGLELQLELLGPFDRCNPSDHFRLRQTYPSFLLAAALCFVFSWTHEPKWRRWADWKGQKLQTKEFNSVCRSFWIHKLQVKATNSTHSS